MKNDDINSHGGCFQCSKKVPDILFVGMRITHFYDPKYRNIFVSKQLSRKPPSLFVPINKRFLCFIYWHMSIPSYNKKLKPKYKGKLNIVWNPNTNILKTSKDLFCNPFMNIHLSCINMLSIRFSNRKITLKSISEIKNSTINCINIFEIP